MSSTEQFAPTVTEYGPDFLATPETPLDESAAEQPQTTRAKNKAKDEPKGLFANLGKNSPARSNVRKLTADDHAKLAGRYLWLAGVVKYVHPRLAQAIDGNAESCAQSWCDLAENNFKVRAKLLAFLEGGEIMGVIMAHTPLLIAALPEKYVAMFMHNIMSAFGQFAHAPQEEPEEWDPQAEPPFQRAG